MLFMRSIRLIAFSALATVGVFSAVLYSSCSKNECGAITCINSSHCMGGVCQCVQGTEGRNCEKVYRTIYAGIYKGIPPDDPNSDTTNTIYFVPSEDTTNYNLMDIVWVDTTGGARVTLPIELYNNTASGSNFNIPATPKGSITYTGKGFIDGKVMTLSLREEFTASGAVRMWYFNNYIRQ